jgi:hypothetical protein
MLHTYWRLAAFLGFLAICVTVSLTAQSPVAPGGQAPAAAPRVVYQPDLLAGEKNFVVGVQAPFLWGPFEIPAPKVPEGFTPIFNGQNLTGWHPSRTNVHGTTPNFWALDGAIVGTQSPYGQGGILLTDKSYKNFDFYMEVKPDYGCDSGVFFRSTEAGHAYQVTMDYLPAGGMGDLILEGISNPGGNRGGTPGAAGRGAGRGGAAPAGNAPVVGGIPLGMTTPNGERPWMKVWKREAWNSVRIRVEGDIPHVQVWMNEQLVTDAHETANRAEGGVVEGPIAIQMHGGNRWVQAGFWRWRNIGIKELP